MKYNFDEHIPRTNTGSVKWDQSEQLFGDKDILPMWVADMDFKVPQPVIDALKAKAEHGIFGYTGGTDSYWDAVIDWMKTRHHWNIQKEWISHAPGVVPALNIIVQAFTSPGDGIMIQSPVYHPFAKVVEMNGRELTVNPLQNEAGRYTMDFADLKEKLKPGVKMLILCSPHNPVGRVWSEEELRELGEICLANDVLIVSDEIHADLVMPGCRHKVFASINEEFEQNSIICTAPSKTFNLAGLQTSNIIIPNAGLREKFKKCMVEHFLGSMNTFGIAAAESAYREGADWLDQLLEYLQGNYDYIKKFLETHLNKLIVSPLEGTYLVWVDCRSLGLDAKELEQHMKKEGKVAFNHGYIFGEGGEGFLRINIACPRSIVEEGMKRLERAVNALS
ncbi:MalY/PatB family protein [Peribacillus sp. SCS-37]|uniref:MalY/PatB family protein n=1 Tax=Paraperibacillus esterisolvens TaxID=3115296 RepID=UPI00390646AF